MVISVAQLLQGVWDQLVSTENKSSSPPSIQDLVLVCPDGDEAQQVEDLLWTDTNQKICTIGPEMNMKASLPVYAPSIDDAVTTGRKQYTPDSSSSMTSSMSEPGCLDLRAAPFAGEPPARIDHCDHELLGNLFVTSRQFTHK